MQKETALIEAYRGEKLQQVRIPDSGIWQQAGREQCDLICWESPCGGPSC